MFSDSEGNNIKMDEFCQFFLQAISNTKFYKNCIKNNLFHHDDTLLSIYEILSNNLDSKLHAYANSIILNKVEKKSQTLLMFANYYSTNYEKSKKYAKDFLNYENFSTTYSYSKALLKNAINDSIDNSDWESFYDFSAELINLIGRDSPIIDELFNKAQNKQTSDAAQRKHREALKNNHPFAPYSATSIDLRDINTKDLFLLINILKALGPESDLVLTDQNTRYIFPSDNIFKEILYNLLANKILKINKSYFDSISEEYLDIWETYFGCSLELNIIGFSKDMKLNIFLLEDEINNRPDIEETCFYFWKKLSYSYFYSTYNFYIQNINDDWIKEYSIPDDVEEEILKSDLSGKKLSYLSYIALKNTVSFHHMGESQGNNHTKNTLTFLLKKYLDIVKNSPTDFSKPRSDRAPIYEVESLINKLTGISFSDLYNITPNINHLYTSDISYD